ncbi:HYR domain-containing protein [Pyxidicoccus fallax]|uniref:HYR domain-containing protein n=1 Tax=Pyxidicoccus fallax TaxID=394095 RepID=A0A848L675_9BACT|nr:ELWxxDGT repeat protein [Pyxidicoccus fallax]NMO14174.1 HYR domain-containing protein [Pyxidicoccus fallax]NPC80358.1 HYR domain-containing protein [Pyxidicoccus fallax]
MSKSRWGQGWSAVWGCVLVLVACSEQGKSAREAHDGQDARPPMETRAEALAPFAPAFLVEELNRGEAPAQSHRAKEVVRAGRFTFFTAVDREAGIELWRTDGTREGTWRVRDIWPGWGSSTPMSLTAVGDTLYFVADDGGSGRELWKSDGTVEGTVLVRDIFPGGRDASPTQLAAFNGQLLFMASDLDGGGLWRSDGTPEGTVRIAGGFTLLGYAEESPMAAVVGGRYLFAGAGSAHGWELWMSDGTAEGTVLVKDIHPGSGDAFPSRFLALGNTLFFVADDGGTGAELWKSDGTEPGTVRVEDLQPGAPGSEPRSLTVSGGRLFFTAEVGDTGTQVYRSDGTPEGTFLVRDLWAQGVSGARLLTDVAGTLYFVVWEGFGAYGLWKSDGSAAGTVRVRSPLSGDVAATVSSQGRLFLLSGCFGGACRLWVSNGTEAGTTDLTNLMFASTAVSPGYWLADHDAALLAWAEDGRSTRALWTSDGTVGGTVRVQDLGDSRSASASVVRPVQREGILYFAGRDAEAGEELWRSDGTAEGTYRVKDLAEGYRDSYLSELTVVGDALYFWTNPWGTSEYELWRSDGTQAGTVRELSLTNVERDFRQPPFLVPVGGRIFFTRSSSSELWTRNGRVRAFPSSKLSGLTAVGDTLFFTVVSWSRDSQELWKSDGTESGTVLVKKLNDNYSARVPDNFLVAGRTLYFWAYTLHTDDSRSLWRSDGTEAGTFLLLPGRHLAGFGLDADAQVVVGGKLFFIIQTPDARRFELWTSDGTVEGTVRVRDLGPYHYSDVEPASMTAMNGRAYFFHNDGVSGYELWTSDGTEAGTHVVRDLRPGPSGAISGRQPLLSLGPQGPLVFAAATDATGRELWQTDGTEAGTVLVQDLAPGARSSNPQPLATSGQLLYFLADDGTTGHELWAVTNPSADRVPPVITCPEDLQAEATSPQGGLASFTATARDDRTASPRIHYSPVVAHAYPFGTTRITATATDEAGLTARCEFSLTVRDTTPPVLTCPGERFVEATGPQGASVSLPQASVVEVASVPSVVYSPGSGVFPLGTTSVSVTATDGAGLEDTCAFPVTVRDTTPPVVSCPREVLAEATGPEGASVEMPAITASDSVSTAAVSFSPASGSIFPLGSTRVSVTATDGAGLSSRCELPVVVVDSTPPTVTCPDDVTLTADGASGNVVRLPEVTASDRVSSSLVVTYVPASGSVFPVGSTDVKVSVRDAAGNTARCGFQVRLQPRQVEQPDAGAPDAGGGHPPPVVVPGPGTSGGCQAGGAPGASEAALLVAGLALMRARRRRAGA